MTDAPETTSWQARVVVDGDGCGPAVVFPEPLSLWGGLNPHTGEVIDRRHPCSGLFVAGHVWILPFGRGSSSSSNVLLEAVRADMGPAAIILRESDQILALGAVVAQEIYSKGPPVLVLNDSDYQDLCRVASQDYKSIRVTAGGRIEAWKEIDGADNTMAEEDRCR